MPMVNILGLTAKCVTIERYTMNEFECLDCHVDTSAIKEYYMVKNKVWRKAHPDDNGMLCISCLETRLGRVLTYKDFTKCLLNDLDDEWIKSPKLRSRLNVSQSESNAE